MAGGPCDGGCGDTYRFMISDTTDGQTKALCPECAGAWGLALALAVLPGEVFAQALDSFASQNGLERVQEPQEPAAEPDPKPRRRRPGRDPVRAQQDQAASMAALEQQREQAQTGIAEGVTD